jgi:NTP pyrophosphatase (non-canonical NTP hydrolase)
MLYTDKILKWADDRNLVQGSNTQAQMLKLMEEVGELAHAVARNRVFEASDALGDMFVVMTILCAQLGISMDACVEYAYEQIKDRRGRMVDGIFIKDEIEE